MSRLARTLGIGIGALAFAAAVPATDFGTAWAQNQVEVESQSDSVTRHPGLHTPTNQVPPNVGEPSLRFPEERKDFGDIDEGEKVVVEFPFENTSEQTVNILDIKTSCGCTAADSDNPKSVEAGKTSSIKVSFNSQGRRGKQSKTVTIVTDDPAHPTYMVSFEGNVVARLYVEPQMVNFGQVDQGTEKSLDLSLKSTLEEPLVIKSAEVTDKRVSIKLKEEKELNEAGRKGTEFVYTITIPADFPQADLNSMVKFETNQPEQQLPYIAVRARVLGDVVASPDRAFAVVRGEELSSKTLTLRSRSEKPFTIKKIEMADKEVPVEWEVVDMEQPFEKTLVATFQGGGAQRTIQTTASLQLEIPGKETPAIIEVPVIMIQRPGMVRQTPQGEVLYIPNTGPGGNQSSSAPRPDAVAHTNQ